MREIRNRKGYLFMKKTWVVCLALIAVAAIAVSCVFGVQKGNLQKTVDDVTAQLNEKAGELETAKADLEKQLTDANTAAETAKADLEKQLADANAAAETAKADLEKQLADANAAAETAKADLEKQLADANAAVETTKADLEKQLADANAAAETAKADLEKQLADANAAAEAAKAELEKKAAEATEAAAAADKPEEAPAETEKEEDWTPEQYAAAADIRTATAADYTGKTVILHSNDVHGQVDGYAWIAGLRTWFEGLGAKVILADCGDFSQGTVYVSTSKGSTAVDMMNAAKYDIVCLGNHEFDFGYEKLMENLSKAEFTALCANVTLDATGESILPATKVIETESGLKIGFFGLETPETVTKVNPGLIKMITFSTFDKLYEDAKKAVQSLKDAGADLTIGLVHLGVDTESKANGYRSLDLLSKVDGIDFLLDGHSHTVMTAGPKGEKIQSTGTKFANVGVVVIDNETKAIEDHFLLPTYLGNKLFAMNGTDSAVTETARKLIADTDAEFNAVFATSEVVLNGEKAPGNRTEETNLGDLITDAMVWSVVKEGGIEQVEPHAVVGITNGGGIRATINAGEVTKKDINTVLPFGNTVAVVYVTGSELLEALEASTFCTPDAVGGFPQTSGIEWTLDTTKAFDQGAVYVLDGKESSYYAPASINRVTIQKINGEEFNPEATYAVVTNNFCAAGGDTYNVFARNSSSFDTGIPMDEAVMAYVAEVLNGQITAGLYGAPAGRMTQIK